MSTHSEAIANADAHTNNAGLPMYSTLVSNLKAARLTLQKLKERCIGFLNHIDAGFLQNFKVNKLRGQSLERKSYASNFC